jgi:ubiquitin-conjugating enzyme E2 O
MDVHFSDSDWEDFSESGSSSEDQEEIELLYGGQALNILSSLEESIGKIDNFLSFERGFMHGDIVCSVTDPSGQMGKVTSINLFVDLENVFGKVVKNMNSKNLSKICTISVGDYVVHGTWLGRVDKVIDSVSVIFDDGSKSEFIATSQEKLVPVSPNLLEDSPYPYNPGQRVQIKLANASKSAGWLCGSSRENLNEGTVCAVEAGFLYVDWLSSVLACSDPLVPAPARFQNAKNLSLLSCFSHSNWQLGDWCILPSSENGVTERVSNLEAIYVILKTKAKVDVVWQDGSYSFGLDSQTLLPVGVVNAHDFLPEQFVLEKGDPQLVKSHRWGVVLGVDAKEQTVKVKWKSVAEKEPTNHDEEISEEIVSAYELVEHPDYSFCYGDVVFRLLHNKLESEHPDTCYLSSIGIVTGLKDGSLEVQWATGLTTKVSPCEVYRIDKIEGSASSSVPYEDSDWSLNQEMIEHGKQFSSLTEKDLLNFNHAGENHTEHTSESNSFSLPQAAIGFFSSIAATLFGSSSSTPLSCAVSLCHASQDGNESENLLKSQTLETCDLLGEPDHGEFPELGTPEDDQEVKQNEEKETYLMTDENPDRFRQFDMVQDCSDNHFLDASNELAQTQVKKGRLKKVQQEWSILERNLPESIYVRAYEERMDLLRAVIIGAPGTPYHDGLFFFDIFLPTDYPNEPPQVHYISGGLRLNPNLYESGKVCLSLLNTWAGMGTEVWNPGSSTILQVLLSLQALVLNEKPYFNEAGYDKQMGRAEGEKNSVSYNENAFLVTRKSMLYVLRKPPKHFDVLVEEHFAGRSQSIMLACKSYLEGAPVGCAFDRGEIKHGNSKGNSTGFKIMLGKLFPMLVEAFTNKGIDCSQFIESNR